MAYKKAFSSAFSRSLDDARHSLVRALRMDVKAPTTGEHSTLMMYGLHSKDDVKNMAIGCDGDIGGLSTARIEVDPAEGKGRFYGTLSNELPRGSKLERSGYAGTRNKARATLFGAQVWDTTVYPYLRLRVRDRLAQPSSIQSQQGESSSLRAALSGGTSEKTSIRAKAMHALGLTLPSKPGPKFFVNVQTDGPVTSDLFQHRLVLDETKGNEWQDVIIPLEDFILTNSGQVPQRQVHMMREAIRTVGISAMLETPELDLPEPGAAKRSEEQRDTSRPPSALRRGDDGGASGAVQTNEAAKQDDSVETMTAAEAEAMRKSTAVGGATTTARGSRRGASYNFDLGIDTIMGLSEDALGGEMASKEKSQ